MAGFIFFVQSGTVLTTISAGFVLIIGSFLGIDLAKMIKDTSALPSGKYKAMKKNRYILSLIFLAALCSEAFVVSKLFDRSLDGVYGSLGAGLMIVLGLLVSGIEANKIATKNGGGK
jgi:hypothetical protein